MGEVADSLGNWRGTCVAVAALPIPFIQLLTVALAAPDATGCVARVEVRLLGRRSPRARRLSFDGTKLFRQEAPVIKSVSWRQVMFAGIGGNGRRITRPRQPGSPSAPAGCLRRDRSRGGHIYRPALRSSAVLGAAKHFQPGCLDASLLVVQIVVIAVIAVVTAPA